MSAIVDYMYQHDAFSQWLGIRRIAEGEGYCTLEMEVRTEMVNGFGIAHGMPLHMHLQTAPWPLLPMPAAEKRCRLRPPSIT